MYKPLSFLSHLVSRGIFAAGLDAPPEAMLPELVLYANAKKQRRHTRTGGQRAHRNWKRTRAAGITKRVRR